MRTRSGLDTMSLNEFYDLGPKSILKCVMTQITIENECFLGVLKRDWVYIKQFLILHPEIYNFVGLYTEKESAGAHSVFNATPIS